MLKSKEVLNSNKASEVWNDGIINILDATDGVIFGNRIEAVHFGERTVGIKRFYEAQSAGHKIEAVISIPYGIGITADDLIELKPYRNNSVVRPGIYGISQIQHPKGKVPDCLYISLIKGSVMFNDERP